jgi:hypothetical protein
MARVFEPTTCERTISPVLRTMTVGQASHIFNKAGIAIEVNEGRGVKFVEGGKDKVNYGA